jgi:hypothetical protein
LLFSTSVSIRFRSALRSPDDTDEEWLQDLPEEEAPKPGCGSTPLELTQTRRRTPWRFMAHTISIHQQVNDMRERQT